MTEEEIKTKISEYKECCKKLAEEYRQRYNEDNTNKLALNMFYHNVISYNDFEDVLAIIEDRNAMIMCFSNPPILTEETVEVDIKRIEALEKENAELKRLKRECETSLCRAEYQYNYEQLTKAKELLKQWLQTSKASGCDNINIVTDTEQFLKE